MPTNAIWHKRRSRDGPGGEIASGLPVKFQRYRDAIAVAQKKAPALPGRLSDAHEHHRPYTLPTIPLFVECVRGFSELEISSQERP